jgi:ATP synthase protein I
LAEQKPQGKKIVRAIRLASLGLEMAVAVAIGWAFGNWLDGKLGTKPWLMLVFLLFGVAAGFRGVYTAARKAVASKPSDGTESP